MAYDANLAECIREALAGHQQVREVRMFGGLSFMVNGKMAAVADSRGRLMLRCDPDRADELLTRPGTDWPEMRGRKMGKGWIVVDADRTASADEVGPWIDEALEYNTKLTKAR